MRAEAGDELTVKSRHLGGQERHGEIIQVGGWNGAPPYLVRWRDGRESLFFPSNDTQIEDHAAHQAK